MLEEPKTPRLTRNVTFLFVLIPFFVVGQVDTALARVEVDSLLGKVDEATKQRDFDQALSLLEQVEEILAAFGKESDLYASCLYKRGRVFYYQRAFAEVESLREEVRKKYR